jgi:hypothetical protein
MIESISVPARHPRLRFWAILVATHEKSLHITAGLPHKHITIFGSALALPKPECQEGLLILVGGDYPSMRGIFGIITPVVTSVFQSPVESSSFKCPLLRS